MRDKSVLKPCPFCGGRAVVVEALDRLYVDCEHKSDCVATPSSWFKAGDWGIEKQIRKWNTRKEK